MDIDSVRALASRREKFRKVVRAYRRAHHVSIVSWCITVAAIVFSIVLYFTPSSEGKKLEATRVFFLDRAKEGNAYIQNDVGTMLLNGVLFDPDPKEGIYWLNQAANKGQVDAMYNLGEYYSRGLGGQDAIPTGRKWLQKAAAQGNAAAKASLAKLSPTTTTPPQP